MNITRRIKRFLNSCTAYKVIQVSFIKNGAYPLMTDLKSLKSDKYDVIGGYFLNFSEACFFVARSSIINIVSSHSDVLLVEAHGLENGDLLAGNGEFITVDNVINMCEGTNIQTIILAACYGDRVLQRKKTETGIDIVYNIGQLYDDDAMIAVKRMIESLEMWDIKRVVRMINNGSNSHRWILI